MTAEEPAPDAPPVADRPLFALDYDGTLAEVVADPDAARPHPDVPELLRGLTAAHPVVVLTGRSVAGLLALLPVPGLRVHGVHGMEAGELGGEVSSSVPRPALEALERARRAPPDVAGVRLEDKGLALALHTRNAADPDAAEAELRRWSEGLPEGLEPLWGKRVLELRPRGYHKGRVVEELMRHHPDRTPVVIGDDTTDEDAFRAAPDGVTVKVGPGESAARYRLPDVRAVVAYLRRYLARGG